jgi:hypothetical protein
MDCDRLNDKATWDWATLCGDIWQNIVRWSLMLHSIFLAIMVELLAIWLTRSPVDTKLQNTSSTCMVLVLPFFIRFSYCPIGGTYKLVHGIQLMIQYSISKSDLIVTLHINIFWNMWSSMSSFTINGKLTNYILFAKAYISSLTLHLKLSKLVHSCCWHSRSWNEQLVILALNYVNHSIHMRTSHNIVSFAHRSMPSKLCFLILNPINLLCHMGCKRWARMVQ